MPHDRNGLKVEPGDVVVGYGYNLPGVVAGTVLTVNESASCNLSLCVTQLKPVPDDLVKLLADVPGARYMHTATGYVIPLPTIEYGDVKSFEVVRKGANGLSPAEQPAVTTTT